MAAEQFPAAGGHQLVKRYSGKWSAGDDRLAVLVIGDLPALGVVAFGANRLRKKRPQALPAPEVALEDGLKGERVQRRHGSHLTRIELARRGRFDTLREALAASGAPWRVLDHGGLGSPSHGGDRRRAGFERPARLSRISAADQ